MRNLSGLPIWGVAIFAAAITGFALGAALGALLVGNVPSLSGVDDLLVPLGGAFGGICALSAILRALERLTV